jgi:hypothetical protein
MLAGTGHRTGVLMESPDPVCALCGAPILGRSNVGRPRLYCTPAHRQRAYEQRHDIKPRRPIEGYR